jgi:hypothetical protein
MKQLITSCDFCTEQRTDTKEVLLSMDKKAWAADICPDCMDPLINYLEGLGMNGPQKRKLPGTPALNKAPAKQPPKGAPKPKHSSAPGQTYKGRKCRGCNHQFENERGRRLHNTRTGCV